MCEAGYDLKLLLKNEENIITETKWGEKRSRQMSICMGKTIYPLFFTKRVLERS